MMERPRFLKSSAGARTHAGRPLRQLVGGVAALCGLFVGLQVWWLVTATPTVAAGPRIIEIPPHLGVLDIARRLDKADIIRSPFGFALLALVQGKARALKAGEYEVPQGANTFAVLSLLEAGRVLYHPVLLKEGGSLTELARAIEAEGLASADDVIRVGHDPLFLRALEIPGASVEGYLFPDTYQFAKGVTPEEMLARMVMKMRAQLTPELLKAARERGINVHQLLTLASIIEREAVVPSELPLISAVFWNRLKLDMPLQADPTVQYATGKGRQPLTRNDLLVDHPYNTYRRPGLPPGPIANPGLLAIRAAANPARVNYLYFVAMDERRHQFSQSLNDHNEAVARYRLGKLH
jgi:peptidoglycan lytic transglycosylase G